jgi:hypothetical protein
MARLHNLNDIIIAPPLRLRGRGHRDWPVKRVTRTTASSDPRAPAATKELEDPSWHCSVSTLTIPQGADGGAGSRRLNN